MELITTHVNTDFDGFAGMIAARKLYPGAELVLSGRVQPNVRKFMSLYKDVWFPLRVSELPPIKIERLILVDTANPARVGNLCSLVKEAKEIHVYDHHPSTPDDVKASYSMIEPLGASTTLLVEILQKRDLSLNSLEATLFCLGIYEDTGSLTFPATTFRDAEAVAFLLRCGANLNIVANYLGYTLTFEQKALLQKLLKAREVTVIHGLRVLVAKASESRDVRGLDLITHKIGEIEDFDVIFVIVQMTNRIYITARSKTKMLLVNEVLEAWQGAGHGQAASAMVRGANLEDIEKQLYNLLREKVRPSLLARNLMSSPVKTITSDTLLKEAGQIMLRYGHTGLPVVDQGVLVGIISRRDVAKAWQYSLEHAPVKGYMSRQVITINPETTLAEIQHLLVEYDIGRLPVVDQTGQIIGIISRSDVLSVLHEGKYFRPFQTLYLDGDATDQVVLGKSWNISGLMQRLLPQFLFCFLQQAGVLGEDLSVSVYLVGNFVRNLLRGQLDTNLELVVEDGFDFAQALGNYLGQPVSGDDNFARDSFRPTFFFLSKDYRLEMSSARTKFYEYPPTCLKSEKVTLRHDLYRRDFTIDTLAVCLNPSCFGQLIDFFGGQRDLLKGFIRILHNFSFVEDPTRILRALVLEQRFGYRLEEQTQILLENAVTEQFLRKVPSVRLVEELKISFQDEKALEIIRRFTDFSLWGQITEVLDSKDLRDVLSRVTPGVRQKFFELLQKARGF